MVAQCKWSISTFCCVSVFVAALLFAKSIFAGDAPESPQKTVISVPVASGQVRKIATIPRSGISGGLSNNPLANFDVEELPCEDNVLHLETAQPLLLEEYPYSSFAVTSNPMFGAQLAGQANLFLPREKYPTPDDLNKRQEKIFEILSFAGVGIARDFFSYGTRRFIIERELGTYDFSNSDFLAGLSSKYQIDLVGRLSPHFGTPSKEGLPTDMGAYLNFVNAVVERYDGDSDFGCQFQFPDCYRANDGQAPAPPEESVVWGKAHRIHYWEVLKEPDAGKRRRMGNDAGLEPSEARQLYQKVHDLVMAIDPEAELYFSGMGPVTPGKYSADSYYQEMLSCGGSNSFDIAGVDAFLDPVAEKITNYKKMLEKSDSQKPIWVGQTGAPDRPSFRHRFVNGGSPEAQCQFLVKVYTEAFAAGAEKVFWGDFFDNSHAESRMPSLWDTMALVETETWNYKAAFFTYRLMATALHDFKQVEKLSPHVYKFTFAARSAIYVVIP